MSDKELKELVASLAVAQKELTESLVTSQREATASRVELAASRIELDARLAKTKEETDKQIKQTQKQLGELGNKWGTFTEGMAIASIKKILFEKFNISAISERLTKRMGSETIEMDAFGYENSTTNTAVIVEIKSHLREDAVEQIETIMADFPKFFPDHANKKLYGIIACVHAPESIKNLLRKKGIYLAVLHDDIFKMYEFKNFIPKDFNQH